MKRFGLLDRARNIGVYAYIFIIPVLAAFVGTVLLFLAAQIPGEKLLDNTFSSALELLWDFEQENHLSPVNKEEYELDTYTDSLIIETSYSMDSANVLMNRIVPGGARPVRLIELLEGNGEATQAYSRYWMGFRVLVRPLLLVMDYCQMRSLSAALLFLLVALAVIGTAKRVGIYAALSLALPMLAMQPWAISGCLQYSCCFILCFAFVTYISWANVKLDENRAVVAFCLLGALTQFFDFYTYPLVAAVPACLLLVSRYEGEKPLLHFLRLVAVWFASWIVMWLLKLVLVTAVNGGAELAAAMESVAGRFGIGEHRIESVSYSVKDAFYRVWYYRTDVPMKLAVPAVALAVLLLFAWAHHEGRSRKLPALLAGAALPVLWMAATAQPIYIHYWFQYRSLFVCFMALLLFAGEALGLGEKENRLWKE